MKNDVNISIQLTRVPAHTHTIKIVGSKMASKKWRIKEKAMDAQAVSFHSCYLVPCNSLQCKRQREEKKQAQAHTRTIVVDNVRIV